MMFDMRLRYGDLDKEQLKYKVILNPGKLTSLYRNIPRLSQIRISLPECPCLFQNKKKYRENIFLEHYKYFIEH